MIDKNEDLGGGVGFIDGEYLPISGVKISVADLGFLMSDVIHDAVHVWKGSFFRLNDHLEWFERSLAEARIAL